MGTTFISADNTLALWTIITAIAATSIILEQKYKWASKITGCVLAMVIAALFSNFKIIPTEAKVYDDVWTFLVPMAIPLLLFKADIKKIWKESGRLVILFLFSSLGTLVGTIVGFFVLKSLIPSLYKVAAMMAGSYVGGSVNFIAMAQSFKASGELASAAVVSDNLVMALYFLLLIALPSISFIIKFLSHKNDKNKVAENSNNKSNLSADFWKAKEISLKDIALCIALSLSIVWVSEVISSYFSSVIPASDISLSFIRELLGNKYLILTTLTMLLASFFSRFFGNLGGSQEIGAFIIQVFFVVIGIPASVSLIIEKSPWLLVFCAIIVIINLIFTLLFGRLFRFKIEEVVMASNANIGGPTTAAAMAIAKGWNHMIVPAMLVGSLGYILGNYFGIFIGNLLMPF
ncbi:MAG: DUF819 family protein [Bacteroidia bacterium]|nr:DUF819 family protein [Bacteroidia bacterium]